MGLQKKKGIQRKRQRTDKVSLASYLSVNQKGLYHKGSQVMSLNLYILFIEYISIERGVVDLSRCCLSNVRAIMNSSEARHKPLRVKVLLLCPRTQRYIHTMKQKACVFQDLLKPSDILRW